MRWNLAMQRGLSLILLMGLGLVVSGCGPSENSIIPTPTQTAPPASAWKGVYQGNGSDPQTPPVANAK